MILTDEQIINLIKNPRAAAELSAALYLHKTHRLHINGDKTIYDDWIDDMGADLESKKTSARKKKMCKPKSPRIYDQIKKQFFKIFRAKGFVYSYEFKGKDDNYKKEFLKYLNDVSYGLSINQFMQVIWFMAMFDEFNGFVAIELKRKDEKKEKDIPEPVCTLYPIDIVHDVFTRGYDVEYIILKTEILIADKPTEAYRVIDSVRDVIFYKKENSANAESQYVKLTKFNAQGEIVEDAVPMLFSKIPFIQVSRYRASTRNDLLKISPVTKSIADADSFLSVSNDHDVSVKMHGNPIFFSFPVMCPTCNGIGNIRRKVEGGDDTEDLCTNCHGNKMVSYLKTDVLQGISLPVAEEYENAGFPAAQAPCGYVTIDTETLGEQRIELDRNESAIEKGVLGVEGILQRSTGQKTLGGQELDLQPLMDTLSSFSSNAEAINTFIVNRIGEVRYKSTFIKADIHYGRKYFLRSEQNIMKEFKDAKEAGANDSFLMELTDELYHVRFENNPKALHRALMLLDIEPLPMRNSVEELLQMIGHVSEQTLKLKFNFNDLVEKFEREFGPITEYNYQDTDTAKEYYTRVEQIQTKLYEYAKAIETPKPEPPASGGTGSPTKAQTLPVS